MNPLKIAHNIAGPLVKGKANIAAAGAEAILGAGKVIGGGAAKVATAVISAPVAVAKSIHHHVTRANTPFEFSADLTQDEFREIAEHAAAKIKRINSCWQDGPVAKFKVTSQSGISEWEFSVDFNAWGELTGQYWISTDNGQSKIPETVANRMKQTIVKYKSQSRFPGVTWYCDECDACLTQQEDFSDRMGIWTCTACGYENKLSEENIYRTKIGARIARARAPR